MRTTLVIAAALALAACGVEPGSEGPKSAHDHGKWIARIYDATFDQAWTAAHAAIRWNRGGTPVDYRGDAGEAYVITKADSSHTKTYDNAQIGVWVDPMNADKVRVSVVVEGPDNFDVGGPNEEQVQKDIEKAIALEKSGQTLPERHP